MKITLPVALLINSTQACDYNVDPSQWKMASGDSNGLKFTRTNGNVRIEKVNGSHFTKLLFPLKTNISTTHPSCDFPQLHMSYGNAQVGFYNFATADDYRGMYVAQAVVIPASNHGYTYTHALGNTYPHFENPLVETGHDTQKYNDVTLQFDQNSGTARLDQNSRTLVDFQNELFTEGVTFMALILENEGEYVDIKDNAGEVEILHKELSACYSGSSTEASLNMVQTDFSVQNGALNDFSATKSSLNTSLIVNYIQFGISAVLAATVAYQYKGIETLKRVANGSDYEKA